MSKTFSGTVPATSYCDDSRVASVLERNRGYLTLENTLVRAAVSYTHIARLN